MEAYCIEQNRQHDTCGTCCHLQVLRTTWDVTSSTEGQTKNAFIDTLFFLLLCPLLDHSNISRLMFFFLVVGVYLVHSLSAETNQCDCDVYATGATNCFVQFARPFFTHVHAASLHFQSKIQSCVFFIDICVLFCVTRDVVK